VHLLEPYFSEVLVLRCDNPAALEGFESCAALVLSPGPGLPSESGALMQVIAQHWGRRPILGVCLGMQALAEFRGGQLLHTGSPRHGIARTITWLQEDAINKGLPIPMQAGYYHSWAVKARSITAEWTLLATDHEGLPAAIRHRTEAVWGLQFHPESVLTPLGKKLLESWALLINSHPSPDGAAP
jgi:anthranilate synthase component II